MRQVVPSFVDLASSAELRSRLTMPGDRAKPVSSSVPHARTPAIDDIAAAAAARHTSTVRRAYVTFDLKDIARILTLPFPSSIYPSEAAHQLTRSVKLSLSDIIVVCNELNPEGLRSATWISGTEYPLKKPFVRVITPETLTTAPLTILMGDCFGQVSRALKDKFTETDALTLLLRQLNSHFDLVDRGYTKLHTFDVSSGTPFFDSS